MRPRSTKTLAAAVLLCFGAASAHASGNAATGKTLFQSDCAMCHGVTPGAMGIGPSLAGIYNQPAAQTPGYQFSPALVSAHLVWNSATLDKFLASPQTDVPGTKMPYAGMASPTQRANVIAYLATLSGK